MAGLMPRHGAVVRRGVPARDRMQGEAAELWPSQESASAEYSPRQQEVLSKAGQLILEWAVEVARYEADIDWQWIYRSDDPAVTASALTRLIRETRSVLERAESLMMAALPDEEH